MPKESRPITTIHNQETDEIVTREMNDDELAAYERDTAAYLAKQAEAQAKATQKTALLERLGLTAEEAALLLS